MHEVHPLLDLLRESRRKVYQPGKEVSVKESLVLFKGRLQFKQYIKTKRSRFGIKLCELTTPTGITLDFITHIVLKECFRNMIHAVVCQRRK